MAVQVVTDTTQYLPSAVVEAEGVHLVSLYVRFGDTLQRESEIADYEAFYERLRTAKDLPTTSQPSVGDFLAVWEPIIEAGDDIVSVHLSAGISGTYDSALQARAQLEERGLGAKVEVVDSATTCGGQAMLVLAATSRARAGEGLTEVARHTRAAREQLKIWFVLDTLEYLRRGGRIGAAQAWVGGALKIKPLLSIESEITPIERVRTSGKAFDRMVEYLRSRHADGADGWCVQHIRSADLAERLVERGREIFGTDPLFVSEVGPVIGAHAGPGMLGIGGFPASYLR